MKNRPYYIAMWNDLARTKQMVFLSGPRQSGKTTLASEVAESFPNRTLFNWDYPSSKRLLIEQPNFFTKEIRLVPGMPLIVFDEIHKYRPWKNYLKGVYDQYHKDYKFLILGSGRLDVYRKGGDSLAGRYGHFNLWPFTIAELANRRRDWEEFSKEPLSCSHDPSAFSIWEKLERFSGFPEPFLADRDVDYRRWSRDYHQQLIREDIRDLSGIRDIEQTATLFSLLPSRIGSPLALQNLAQDLHVSHTAIRSWLSVFESLYLVFRISPWTKKISRAIGRQQKLYLLEAAQIPDEGARFENMVALELWRAVHSWNDWGWGTFGLHYLRNKEKEETDFLVTQNNEPFLLIEAKLNDDQFDSSLEKYQALLKVPAVQVVRKPRVRRQFSQGENDVLIVTAADWLSTLP